LLAANGVAFASIKYQVRPASAAAIFQNTGRVQKRPVCCVAPIIS
jgi:hypothetical protein